MAKRRLDQAILDALTGHEGPVGALALGAELGGEPRSTLVRHLAALVQTGAIVREGSGPSTVYRLARSASRQPQTAVATTPAAGPALREASRALRTYLQAPLGTRTPSTYQRAFVDQYRPNISELLPAPVARELIERGRMPGQQPAGTYARRVLEPLLIDLSWYSSRLEGNRKSLLDTKDLFQRGRSADDDSDTTMLLNHKDAIEFLVDEAPQYGGITTDVIRTVHSFLMDGLLHNPAALGGTRRILVTSTDTVYQPTQIPALLDEMLEVIAAKAREIRNPLECAFFLWVNLAYLQPFEDGNKRTSRLCANLPLLFNNCAPLSFLDVEQADYALAMLGVYERQDVSLAVDLFEWTYRRSIEKYRVLLEAMGPADPIRARYRGLLGDAVRQVVTTRATVAAVVDALKVPAEDRNQFAAILRQELAGLAPYNCARYRLTQQDTEAWIFEGRPT